jgi:hypothetical protein
VDGVPADSFSDPAGYTPSSQALYIGNGNTTYYSAPFFHGLIDEVSIYNLALSATEVQALYTAGSSGKCLTPIYIASVNRSGSNVNLSWLSQKGMTYRVQYRNDLASGTWTDCVPPGDITGAGSSTSAVVPVTSANQFYRIKMFQ